MSPLICKYIKAKAAQDSNYTDPSWPRKRGGGGESVPEVDMAVKELTFSFLISSDDVHESTGLTFRVSTLCRPHRCIFGLVKWDQATAAKCSPSSVSIQGTKEAQKPHCPPHLSQQPQSLGSTQKTPPWVSHGSGLCRQTLLPTRHKCWNRDHPNNQTSKSQPGLVVRL